MYTRHLFSLFLLFISFLSNASEISGTWGTVCDGDGFFIDIKTEQSPLVVNDNQIVLSVHSSYANGVISIFFDKTLDLGRGGMNIKWSDFDKEKKIAEMIVSNGIGQFKWFGFFNKKSHVYFWSSEPDFVRSYSNDGIINMKKCT